jgi:hypothetical protein
MVVMNTHSNPCDVGAATSARVKPRLPDHDIVHEGDNVERVRPLAFQPLSRLLGTLIR